MAKNPFSHSEDLYEYIKSMSVRETQEQILLREITQKMSMGIMQISPDQGQFMAMLVKLMSAKKVIEVGTFTGYSALSIAMALPDDGILIACDVSKEWTDIGKPFWQQAGVAGKIDLRIAPAIQTLDQLISDGRENSIDLAFIDADKSNYSHYYEKALKLLRKNGVILIDNVFWGGAVIDDNDISEDTLSIRSLNEFIRNDERVDISMLSIGDGLLLARKR